jgi:hypothetical protein
VDAGAVLIVIVVVAVLPPLFMMLGGIVSALIGWTSKSYAERKDEGSEFIDLNY